MNHETSRVPFPYNTAAPTAANGENDFDNAQVSRLIVNQQSGGVLNGSFVVPSSAGYQRFCSSYLATEKEGFDREILFANEEAIDYVLRRQDSWPPAIGDPNEKQVGLVVALDVRTGKHRAIHGMGRHNHENSVAIPGFEDLVVLSGDDTFTSGPLTVPPGGPVTGSSRAAQSQLYSYLAEDTDSLLADEGELWAFVSDDAGFNDYYDFTPGSTASVSGHFVKVPKNIATGLDTDGSELKAADVGFPLPPNDGSWQRDNRTTVPTGLDGPQWVLEYWSQLNDVFQFVRVEDVAYDKRPGMENVVYVVDSGRGTAGASQAGRSTNGRVWKMVLDADDPTVVEVALRGRRGRRQRSQDPRRDPPARQHRVDALGPARDGGSGLEPAVHGGTAGLGCRPSDHGAAVVGAVLGLAPGRREGRPVGRRRPDGRRRTPRRQLGCVGDERHRRRVGGLRPRLVPDRRAGELTLGREGSG